MQDQQHFNAEHLCSCFLAAAAKGVVECWKAAAQSCFLGEARVKKVNIRARDLRGKKLIYIL